MSAPATSGRTSGLVKLALFVAVLAAAWFIARQTGLLRYAEPAQLREAIAAARGSSFALPAFIAIYAVVAGLGLPGTPLTLAGGALFGAVAGTAANWVGATLGATIAFLLARALGKDALRSFLGARAAGLDKVAGSSGLWSLLRLRLIPVVPFNALNFGSGFTGISLRDYVMATAIGILPGTAIYTSFADALLAGASGARESALVRVAIAGGALVALSFVPALAKRFGWLPASAALLVGASTIAPMSPAAAQGKTVDHAAFDQLLKQHVTNGIVDYDAFGKAPTFKAYLSALGTVDPATLGRDERLTFWINAYNAFTIDLIVTKGETQSIRNVNKSLGFLKLKGPWSDPFIRINGKMLTLDNIEHDIIRKEFGEPRIHFALVCAAMGCPPLRSEAYVAARLNEQLQEQGVKFIRQSPGKNRVDLASQTLFVSLIFNYYKKDFGGTEASVGKYLAPWYPAGSPERAFLEKGQYKFVQTEYDWTLNSVAQARAQRVTTVMR
ncbi:MAG: DUF547 domain-containing protein [Gemmatimonadaceae bacterium]|jgi:uncharacterized membrane protein YdjX (TVP38/TMEM64 family)|nr:DUF547 domain-containing protein [Gemmatimonadaceae bacterium]